jgi:tRNA modification GTPase
MTKPSTLPEPRKATLRTIFSPNDPADIIDRGIIVYFPGPNSYTGEDVLEIQVHGGISVVRDLLQALSQLPGLIAAEPGEFTRVRFPSY